MSRAAAVTSCGAIGSFLGAVETARTDADTAAGDAAKATKNTRTVRASVGRLCDRGQRRRRSAVQIVRGNTSENCCGVIALQILRCTRTRGEFVALHINKNNNNRMHATAAADTKPKHCDFEVSDAHAQHLQRRGETTKTPAYTV